MPVLINSLYDCENGRKLNVDTGNMDSYVRRHFLLSNRVQLAIISQLRCLILRESKLFASMAYSLSVSAGAIELALELGAKQ